MCYYMFCCQVAGTSSQIKKVKEDVERLLLPSTQIATATGAGAGASPAAATQALVGRLEQSQWRRKNSENESLPATDSTFAPLSVACRLERPDDGARPSL